MENFFTFAFETNTGIWWAEHTLVRHIKICRLENSFFWKWIKVNETPAKSIRVCANSREMEILFVDAFRAYGYRLTLIKNGCFSTFRLFFFTSNVRNVCGRLFSCLYLAIVSLCHRTERCFQLSKQKQWKIITTDGHTHFSWCVL